VHIFRLGRFQAAGSVRKPGIVYDMAERFLADFPFPNVLMPVHVGTEIRFRIVQVKRQDLIQPDQRFNLPNGSVPTFNGAKIITGGEKVRGIQTDSESRGLLHSIIDGAKVGDPVAQTTSLPGGVFQRDADVGLGVAANVSSSPVTIWSRALSSP